MIRRFAIAESSMTPALQAGDFVVTVPLRQPSRGAIVVFTDPRESDFTLVKRIIGLPGEVVEIANGVVTIDGQPLDDRWSAVATEGDGTWSLPNTSVFVLGDLRTMSSDSRTMGPIPTDGCQRVVARYWPRPRLAL